MIRCVTQCLLLLSLCPLVVVAQDISVPDLHSDDGIPVRPTSRISFPEKIGLVLEGALVPGKKLVEPLHAYEPKTVCSKVHVEVLAEHIGTAAIIEVSMDPETDIAHYRPTVSDAITYARENWCKTDRKWFFATTYPLRGTERGDVKARYLSRDVDRIDELLVAYGTERKSGGTVQ